MDVLSSSFRCLLKSVVVRLISFAGLGGCRLGYVNSPMRASDEHGKICISYRDAFNIKFRQFKNLLPSLRSHRLAWRPS
jgi:hypothetical protein